MKRYIHEPKTYVNEVVYNNYGTTYPSTNSATVVSNTGQSGPSVKSVTLIELQQILSNYLRIDNVPDELVEAVAAKLDPVMVDGELSTTSVNPVQNKVITHYIYQLDEKDLNDIIDSTGLKDTWSNKQDQLTFNEGIESNNNTVNVLYNSNKLELDQDNQITLKYEYIKQLTDFSNYSPSSNEIVQYVGPTDDNYTNGYIYKYTNRWIPVLSNDVILYYDSTNTKLQIKDSLGDVISEIDASDFVKDGMLSSVEFYNEAEQGVSTVAPYIKFTFNSDGGDNIIRVSLVDIIPIIDTELNIDSNNAVRNSVITSALNLKANSNDLATVATSGSYTDLINKPTNVSTFTNDVGYLTQHQDISGKVNRNELATVATSGSYNDLSDKPNIPSELTAGTNIDITNNVISATDTTYQSSDFDIKDLSDSTNLKSTWSNKQDQMSSGNGIDITNNFISVKYDNSTIKLDNNGNLYADVQGFSGDYNDLTNKPTIPVVPTDVSAFNNDVGYLTQHQDVSSLQPKTLDTSLTIDGTTVTTVEGALDALNNRPSSSGGVTSVDYDTQNKKLTQTISGSTTDIVTVSTLKNDMQLSTISTTIQNNVISTAIQGDAYVNSGSLNAVGGDITCIPSQGASQITMTGLNTSLGTKVTNDGGVSSIIALTQSAYDNLSTIDPSTLYVITD